MNTGDTVIREYRCEQCGRSFTTENVELFGLITCGAHARSREARPDDRLCKSCSRPYATYVERVCQGAHCIDCQIFEPSDTHWEMLRDADEVVSYQCPHGTSYDELCKGRGAKVGGWGVGMAGFGELCGCAPSRL